MEQLSTPELQQLPGDRVLRLVALEEAMSSQDIERPIHSVAEVRNQLILAGGLKSSDTLFINGENSLNLLPRPDAFGNCILSLMDHLDSISPNTRLSLEIEEVDNPAVAAD